LPNGVNVAIRGGVAMARGFGEWRRGVRRLRGHERNRRSDCRHEQHGREMKVAQGHLKRWAREDDDRPLEDVL